MFLFYRLQVYIKVEHWCWTSYQKKHSFFSQCCFQADLAGWENNEIREIEENPCWKGGVFWKVGNDGWKVVYGCLVWRSEDMNVHIFTCTHNVQDERTAMTQEKPSFLSKPTESGWKGFRMYAEGWCRVLLNQRFRSLFKFCLKRWKSWFENPKENMPEMDYVTPCCSVHPAWVCKTFPSSAPKEKPLPRLGTHDRGLSTF